MLVVVYIPYVVPFTMALQRSFNSLTVDLRSETFVQLVVMPLLAPALGEERMLSIGLLFNCAHVCNKLLLSFMANRI